METATLCSAPKGRPREFCVDQALAAALRVFWSKGYEGASLNELTEAMGITKPSLYAAFGNKEALFGKALDLYESEKLAYTRAALEQPSARAVAEYFLRGALAMQTSSCDPHGCMSVISSVSSGPEAEGIRAAVLERRASSQAALLDRFERAKAAGDIPTHIDVATLARYLFAIIQGMALQASCGATPRELTDLVNLSLDLWPGR